MTEHKPDDASPAKSDIERLLTPEFIRAYITQEAKVVRHQHYREFHDQAKSVQVGNVLIIHGYRENVGSAHYRDLTDYFVERKFNVVAYDLPRFGRSPAERPELEGQIVSFAELVRSAKSMLFAILDSEQKSRVPTSIVANSIGGLVVCRLLQIYPYLQQHIASIVIIAGPFRVEHNARKELLKWKKIVKPFFKLLVRIRPHFAVDHYEPDEFSKDDPHHYKGAMDAWTANQILIASEKTNAHLKKIRIPVLFVHGKDDKVAPLDAMERAFGAVGTARDDKDKRVYPNIDHHLLQRHRHAMEDIVKWVSIRTKLAKDSVVRIHYEPGKIELRFDQFRAITWKFVADFMRLLWNILCDLFQTAFRRNDTNT